MHRSEKGVLHHLRMALVTIAFLVAVCVPVYFAVAALGVRFGVWDWRFGLIFLSETWGARIIITSAALSVLTLLAVFLIRPRGHGAFRALLAVILSGGVIYQGLMTGLASESTPPINDITTDMDNPPAFSQALIALREATGAETPMDYDSKFVGQGSAARTFADVQKQAYPAIKSMVMQTDAASAFDAALRTAQSLGWVVHYADRDAGRLDATDRTFWFGFTDDITIRIRSVEGGGSIIDVRSMSRVGASDLGANADRIMRFRDEIDRRLN